MLEARGMKPEEVQQLKEQNWSFFLRSSRRLVPRSDVLLNRFDRVVEEFRGCVDHTSREVLLRPKAMKAVRQLRKHIENDCLSDPDGMAMYFAIGKNKHGLTDYRCIRGTNDVEVRGVRFIFCRLLLLPRGCLARGKGGLAARVFSVPCVDSCWVVLNLLDFSFS